MSYPTQISSTLLTKEGKERQSLSLEVGPVAGDIVIAQDREDGLSYIERVMAMGGPAGGPAGGPVDKATGEQL
jgi:hypothetical protein